MRLAFSTLGCPAWSPDQIVDAAVGYGYHGVEIRGIQEHVDLRHSPYFQPARLSETRTLFSNSGLSICCLGSSASFADPGKRASSLEEARAYVDLAAELECPLVRVFGGAFEGQSRRDSICAVADSLRSLAPYAAERGVKLCLETHDSFSTGRQVAEVLFQVENPSIGALWDLHHPYREGESPDETLRALGHYLLHCHVKDSRNGAYSLLGEGDVPIREMLRLLRERSTLDTQGSAPWISVEWEKRWHPEIADPEAALPQYAAKLREYLGDHE